MSFPVVGGSQKRGRFLDIPLPAFMSEDRPATVAPAPCDRPVRYGPCPPKTLPCAKIDVPPPLHPNVARLQRFT